ncbi:MAG TPA: hypothetical protein VH857_11415 [Actinomycetes bacterium]|jgi:hypothetical protein|nr:hypothetical protein [Actinomycetes bacterium]
MSSPDGHAAIATQRHADLLAQAEQARTVRLARLARTARPGGTRGATSSGRSGSSDLRGMVDELRGYWGRRSPKPVAAA